MWESDSSKPGCSSEQRLHGASEVREVFENTIVPIPKRLAPIGEIIHRADTPAEKIFFIHRGEVRLYQAGPDGLSRLVDILGPGDWFGIAALAGSPTCEKSAVAVSTAAISEMPVEQFLGALEENPPAATAFMRQLAQRLHTARTTAARFVFDDCERRILKTLIDFSQTAAASRLEGDEILLRITHNQLAQAIGVARETVSLALTKLRRQNLLQTGRNKLVFNPIALREFEARGVEVKS